jgi:NAD-dependent deacetylase
MSEQTADRTGSSAGSSTLPRIAVLTGAGISTSAGIPDFRGPNGVWTKHPDQTRVYDIDAFLSSKEAREYSWRWQKESPVWTAQPGRAHHALVRLRDAGILTVIATQNFDGLHEKAQKQWGKDDDTSYIVNLHGTIATSHCLRCGKKYDTAQIMDRLDEEPDPHCHKPLPDDGEITGRQCGGLLKTDVTYFGEALPDGAMDKAERLILGSDELWVIGSTLEVFPAASLVPIAAQANIPITIMNMGSTQFDYLASRYITDPIQDALPALVKKTLEGAKR